MAIVKTNLLWSYKKVVQPDSTGSGSYCMSYRHGAVCTLVAYNENDYPLSYVPIYPLNEEDNGIQASFVSKNSFEAMMGNTVHFALRDVSDYNPTYTDSRTVYEHMHLMYAYVNSNATDRLRAHARGNEYYNAAPGPCFIATSYCLTGKYSFPDNPGGVTQTVYGGRANSTGTLWVDFLRNRKGYTNSGCIITKFGDLVIIKGSARVTVPNTICANASQKVLSVPSGYRMSFSRGLAKDSKGADTGHVGMVWGGNSLNTNQYGGYLKNTVGASRLYYNIADHCLYTKSAFGLPDYGTNTAYQGNVQLALFAAWNIKDNGEETGS